jgi:hypothetical protein
MQEPTFYALVLIGENGAEQLGGAFSNFRAAKAKGEASGGRYEVKPVFMG